MKKNKAFTLVELMVVIVIIGILAALAIPRFLGATNKTKATEFKPVLKQIYTLQEAYKQERDTYGSTATDIGFDQPDTGAARFNYGVSSAATSLGVATVKTNSIKDLTGKVISTTDGVACIDTTGLHKVKSTTFQGVTGGLKTGC